VVRKLCKVTLGIGLGDADDLDLAVASGMRAVSVGNGRRLENLILRVLSTGITRSLPARRQFESLDLAVTDLAVTTVTASGKEDERSGYSKQAQTFQESPSSDRRCPHRCSPHRNGTIVTLNI
jgi:hypothetical protein